MRFDVFLLGKRRFGFEMFRGNPKIYVDSFFSIVLILDNFDG